jgi:uncharacterized protein (TIGR03437 family)
VNPTGLSPGSYSGAITIGTFPASGTTTIPVTLSISNPPSALIVSPPFPVPSYYTPDGSGANASVRFDYTTGQSGTLPLIAELDVASNGGIIPFSVVAFAGSKAAPWLRINVSNQLPNSQTSGVALSGSYVPIDISIDLAALSTLDVGSYPGTITFTNNSTSGTTVVNVNLNVSAGAPKVDSIFPASVVAGPATGRVPPVITIYGNNFFNNSSVRLTRDGNVPFPDLPATLLSRKVLQAKVDPSYLTSPGTFTLTVANTKTLADPNPHEDSIAFTVADATVPLINSIVNSASYLKTATQTGSAPNPVPAAGTGTSVSPREIISIFGQNLGPAAVTQAQASTGLFPNTYPTQVTVGTAPNTTTYQAIFTFEVDPTCIGPACMAPAPLVPAPLIMVASNQINALVPVPPMPSVLTAAGLNAWVQIVETIATGAGVNTVSTDWLPVTVVLADPGAFTFGGLGLGQAAVLNYDVSAGYSINSAKNPAPKGSTVSLYATGLGDLMTGVTVAVTDSSATPQKDSKTFGLIISASPAPAASLIITPASPPAGTQNTPFLATTLQAAGGTPPYQWSVASGLPPGLSLNSAGLLTGTPTVAGVYTMAVTVTDSGLPKLPAVSTTYAIAIGSPIVTITTAALPDGMQSGNYTSTTLQATGGTAPYQWTVISGLPPGLSLTSAGVLTGIPTSANTYALDVQVQDSSTPPVTGVAGYPLKIVGAGGIAITSPLLPGGVVNVAYTTTALKIQGGTLPLNWFVSTLPAGLSLDPVKGVLSGTPTSAGTTSVTVTAIDSGVPALTDTYTYSLTVAPALGIVTLGPLPAGQQQSVAYAALTMQAQGGTPPYKWTASGLPPGLILNSSTGVLSGVPTTEVYLPLPDGAVALGAVYLADNTYRVDIDGQPAVTSYAGASQGSVAGLVQINAIVPPTARTGAAISLTVSIGSATSARRSQLGVTLAVK